MIHVSTRIRMIAVFTILTMGITVHTRAFALELSCDTPVEITSGTYVLNADFVKTTPGNCFQITGNNVTLDLNGHKIICRRAGTCSNAISVTGTNALIKDGSIVSDTGNWFFGLNCNNFGATLYCSVQNVFVENAIVAAISGAKRVERSVITNSTVCIDSVRVLPTGGNSARYWQNFCDASDVGINAIGPTSGTPFIIERNFVRASATGAPGVRAVSGLFTVEQNVIQADEPIDDSSATVTTSTNVCDDPGDCPLPTQAPFTFDLDF